MKPEELIIEMPKGYMNTEVSICNHFIADTNDSSNWDTLKFPLPKGKWSIKSVESKIVTLIKQQERLEVPNDKEIGSSGVGSPTGTLALSGSIKVGSLINKKNNEKLDKKDLR
jgi:hypothetical protein